MPIYGKNTFFSETNKPMIFELGIQHREPGLYKVYPSDDPGMTMTFFMTRSNDIYD